jgi:hypothetical protein
VNGVAVIVDTSSLFGEHVKTTVNSDLLIARFKGIEHPRDNVSSMRAVTWSTCPPVNAPP